MWKKCSHLIKTKVCMNLIIPFRDYVDSVAIILSFLKNTHNSFHLRVKIHSCLLDTTLRNKALIIQMIQDTAY